MRSRLVLVCLSLLLVASAALAQSDRGTITGRVSDATDAVIPGASVVATNSQTGVRFETVTTESGNYALPQLPAGVYEVSGELPGFKRFVQQGITVLVAQTLRININLEVGAAGDEITVTADAPLLRTESGDLSHNVTTERLTELPILSSGASGSGSSAIRNPLAETQLIPGTFWQPNTNVVVNGLPTNSETIRIEGQDSTNRLIPFAQAQTQPSVDAIQEVSIQTSNYAAEFGQAGGGIFNYTMKSGTNDYHGTVFDMVRDDALNAGTPFTSTGGSNTRSDVRSHNWGWSFGGPFRLGNLRSGGLIDLRLRKLKLRLADAKPAFLVLDDLARHESLLEEPVRPFDLAAQVFQRRFFPNLSGLNYGQRGFLPSNLLLDVSRINLSQKLSAPHSVGLIRQDGLQIAAGARNHRHFQLRQQFADKLPPGTENVHRGTAGLHQKVSAPSSAPSPEARG